jgi:hypothetical protein
MYGILGGKNGQKDRARRWSWREGVWKWCGEMRYVGGRESTPLVGAIWVSRDARTEEVRC